ncbi:MAG: DUF2207 domain-containing protein [Actinomycetota bacterium]
MRRAIASVVLVLAATSLAVLAGVRPAAAGSFETIRSYDVDITMQPNGDLAVVETIVYDFGPEQRHGIFRDIPTRLHYDDTYDRVTPLRVDSVTESGTPAQYSIEDAGDGKSEIKIGNPDQLITGVHEYRIAYTVQGAMNSFPNRDELYWNAIGDEWDVTIQRATVRVSTPGRITGVACFQGQQGSSDRCGASAYQGGVARFAEAQIFPSQGLTVVVGVEKGAVTVQPPILQERWSAMRAFAITPVTGSAAGALAIAGIAGFGFFAWTRGRDRRYRGSQVDQVMGNPHGDSEPVPIGDADAEGPVEFAPPDGIRPGQIGTLVDERANTLDVSATIVDLAVRGSLQIHEIPKEGFFGKPDWRLVRSEADDAALLPYERMLLEGLFRDGNETTLSALRTSFADRLAKVEDSLYADAHDQGWFVMRPDRVRLRWRLLGFGLTVLGIAATVALAATTHLGLIGLAALVVGLVFWFGAGRMPARTAKGTAMLRRVRGYRRVIDTADRYMARWAEQEQEFPKMLPYAIVFGLTDRWAHTFQALAAEAPAGTAPIIIPWYVSAGAFSADGFAHAIDGFTVATSGTMTATPAGSGTSGFGGGGFSGGGFGGGGGGSW